MYDGDPGRGNEPAPERIFTPEEMSSFEREAFALFEKMELQKRNPYHNAMHAREVLERVRALVSVSSLPKGDTQVAELAALFHDYGHPGRLRDPKKDGCTNEEFSAEQADRFVKEKGFSERQRTLLRGLIIATTVHVPGVEGPKTHLQNLFALADSGGWSRSWEEWIAERTALLQEVGEATPERLPATVAEWLQKMKNDLFGFVHRHMIPEVAKAWGKELREKEQIIDALLQKQEGEWMDAIEKNIVPRLRKNI